MKLKLDGFFGTVSLKESMIIATGDFYFAIMGNIFILKDEEVAGFKVKGSESNWIARVQNGSGTESINILGCQIRSIHQHEEKMRHSRAVYLVGSDS